MHENTIRESKPFHRTIVTTIGQRVHVDLGANSAYFSAADAMDFANALGAAAATAHDVAMMESRFTARETDAEVAAPH